MQEAHLKCSSMGGSVGVGAGGGKHPLHTRCPLRDSQSDFLPAPSPSHCLVMLNHTHTFQLLQSNQIESFCLSSTGLSGLPVWSLCALAQLDDLVLWCVVVRSYKIKYARPLQTTKTKKKKNKKEAARNLNGKATSCQDERASETVDD